MTIDQMGRTIRLAGPPLRIISLVPSQTELLVDLGLKDRLAGITRYCVHPSGLTEEIPVVGGTKDPDLEKIHTLRPDLIIGNKEENDQAVIEKLSDHFPVWMSDIKNLQDAIEMILALGNITGTLLMAETMTRNIQSRFDQLKNGQRILNNKKTLYLIWRKPYMAVGPDTFIADMLRQCGLSPVPASRERYIELTAEQILSIAPDHIFLSSEPFPFAEKHLQELGSLCPLANIRLVDGEMFSWYGSRLLKAPVYFEKLLAKL